MWSALPRNSICDLHHSLNPWEVSKWCEGELMAEDLPRLMHHTRVLIEVSEALCNGSMRAIERSKRLLDTIDAERASLHTAQRSQQQAKLNCRFEEKPTMSNR